MFEILDWITENYGGWLAFGAIFLVAAFVLHGVWYTVFGRRRNDIGYKVKK